MFVKECHAVCCLPGGFGTLDEGLEVLTLLQTGKRDMCPVVFLDAPGGSFWRDWHEYTLKHLLGGGMISPEDTALYKLTDSVPAAVAEILQFYRVYHSMRYVKQSLVLRLKQPITGELLEELNYHFADVLSGGAIELSAALKDERDEPQLAELPRLSFRFNRRSLGRLRMMIDAINRGSVEPQADEPLQ